MYHIVVTLPSLLSFVLCGSSWLPNVWGYKKCSEVTQFIIHGEASGRHIFLSMFLKMSLFLLNHTSKLCFEKLWTGFLRQQPAKGIATNSSPLVLGSCFECRPWPLSLASCGDQRCFPTEDLKELHSPLSICSSTPMWFCKRPSSESPRSFPILPLTASDNPLKTSQGTSTF